MFHPPFRTVPSLFPVLFILLLPAGGCSLSSGSGEIPAEETQPRPVPDSAMEEELQDLRRRVEFLENRLAPGKPVTPRPPAKSAPARPKSAPASKAAAPAPTPSAPAVQTEQNAYDMALGLYRTGRFAQAEAAFRAFLEAYPNSRLTPNALYWMGETFYSRGMFSDAIFAFKDVQARFPRHAKTPDSLLKTALAYSRLGDRQNAELHLTVLKEDWPKSEAVARAKQMGLF